jgi:ketosteroid isomerase-like protein
MTSDDPTIVVERIRDAVNRRDLEALMSCYADNVRGEEPTLVDRDFRGSVQLRADWGEIFAALPEFSMELLDCVCEGHTVWAEWRWRGRRADGAPFLRTGVIIYDVRDDCVVRLRRYMGPMRTSFALAS